MIGYKRLANEIIVRAVYDYRSARQILARRPSDALAQQMKNECEMFFLSEWFCELTNVDGEYLLEKLRKEEVKQDDKDVYLW